MTENINQIFAEIVSDDIMDFATKCVTKQADLKLGPKYEYNW